MNPSKNTFSDRIAVLVERAGSQYAFAMAAGVNPASVGHWLHKGMMPRTKALRQIAAAFRVREKWLKTGEGPMDIAITAREPGDEAFAQTLAATRKAALEASETFSDPEEAMQSMENRLMEMVAEWQEFRKTMEEMSQRKKTNYKNIK